MILFLTSLEKVDATSSHQQQQVTKYASHDVLLQNKTQTTKNVSFLPVVYVAIINSVVNVMRPGELCR